MIYSCGHDMHGATVLFGNGTNPHQMMPRSNGLCRACQEKRNPLKDMPMWPGFGSIFRRENSMAFKDDHPELAEQIETAAIPRENIVAAIRYLASAIEDGQHDTMRQRIEDILKAEN